MKFRVMTAMGVAMVLGSGLIAQRAGGQQPGGGGFGRMINPGGAPAAQGNPGFGRLIYPGTGGPVAARAPRVGGPAYAVPPPVTHPQSHGRAILVPYPVFYGGGYYGYDAPPAPYAGGYYSDPSGQRQDAPAVIINQNFVPDTVNPSFQDYSNVQLPPPTLRRYDNTSQPYQDPAVQAAQAAPAQNDQPSLYLIALKDHTIYAAIGYWTEETTLHYITPENVHNRVTLDQVDRAFTKQLNDERHIDFRLPE
jgi:hypothetical protein